MSERLPSGIVVGAMLRLVNDAGGMAMVRARGDAQAGAVLVLLEDGRALERGPGSDGDTVLVETRRADAAEPADDYWRRRRTRDPDLWVIELSGRGTREALALLT